MIIEDRTDWDFAGLASILDDQFDSQVKYDYPLSELNTFRTGGNSRIFIDVTKADNLAAIFRVIKPFKAPLFILGGGSNILVSDHGFNGIVIKNSIKEINREDSLIKCGSGESLEDLIRYTASQGLTGLEFAMGIWGTVGGAVYGNAGAYGGEIKDVIKDVELVDKQGNIKVKEVNDINFRYRWSEFKESGDFITGVKLALKKGDKDTILSRIDEIMAIRMEKLPYDKPTAGCIFKNIPDPKEKHGKIAAGRLLEELDAKSMSQGMAGVSEKHANIIVNNGGASSDDIKKLVDRLKKRVFSNFGVELQEEIILLGKFN